MSNIFTSTPEHDSNLSELENLLINILLNKWIQSSLLYDSVSTQYSRPIKPKSVFRAVRRLRDKNYFVFIKSGKNGKRYKVCPMDDTSQAHDFFVFEKEDIVKNHNLKNSWTNIV